MFPFDADIEYVEEIMFFSCQIFNGLFRMIKKKFDFGSPP